MTLNDEKAFVDAYQLAAALAELWAAIGSRQADVLAVVELRLVARGVRKVTDDVL